MNLNKFKIIGIIMLILLTIPSVSAAVTNDDIEVKIINIWGSNYPIILFSQNATLGQVVTADLDSSPISEPEPTLTSRPRNEDKSVVSRFKLSDTKVRILAYIAGGKPYHPGSEGYIKITNPNWKITEIIRGQGGISHTTYGTGLNIDKNNGLITWSGRDECLDCIFNENEFILEFIVELDKTQLVTPSPTTPAPTATLTSTPIPSSKSTSSVNLYGEKTNVVLGENVLLILSATNIIGNPIMHVQVIIIPPNGWSVTSSEFSKSGAGQYVTMYDLKPEDGSRHIKVNIMPNQIGDNFEVEGRIIYYFGDDISTREDRTLKLPIKVREIPTPTSTPTISFWASILIFGILYNFIKRNR